MPCDRVAEGQSPAQREAEVESALKRLERALRLGEVRVKVGRRGEVAFVGEWERGGVSDLCAYRKLSARGSDALRFAKARGEALAGARVDEVKVAAGVHSHDGGKTWGKD